MVENQRECLSDYDKKAILDDLKRRKPQNIMDLVKEDLDYGVSREEVYYYTDARFDINKMKLISKGYRNNYGLDVIKRFTSKDIDYSRMAVAFEFYDKGVSVEDIEKGILGNDTARELKAAFEIILQQAKKVENTKPNTVDEEQVHMIMDKINDMVTSIKGQEEKYAELNKRLDVFEKVKLEELEVEKKDDEIKTLKNHNSDLQQEVDQLKKQLDDLNISTSDLSTDVSKGHKKIAELRNLLQDKDDIINTLKDKVVGLEIELNTGKEATKQSLMREEQLVSNIKYKNIEEDNNPVSKVEFSTRKSFAFVDILTQFASKKKSSNNIVKLVARGELSFNQLEQIKRGMENNLSEEQLSLIINSNISAEQMKGIVDIAIIQNRQKKRGDSYA